MLRGHAGRLADEHARENASEHAREHAASMLESMPAMQHANDMSSIKCFADR